MGKLLLSLFLISALSCTKSKSDTKCYRCQITQGVTTPAQTKDVCTNRIDTMHFEEPNSNSLGFDCTEK